MLEHVDLYCSKSLLQYNPTSLTMHIHNQRDIPMIHSLASACSGAELQQPVAIRCNKRATQKPKTVTPVNHFLV